MTAGDVFTEFVELSGSAHGLMQPELREIGADARPPWATSRRGPQERSREQH
jgi:hypothetical protein